MQKLLIAVLLPVALAGCSEAALDRTILIGNEVFRESECIAQKLNTEEVQYTIECPSLTATIAVEPIEGKIARVEIVRPDTADASVIEVNQITDLLDVMFGEK